jgi:hypothetical protein
MGIVGFKRIALPLHRSVIPVFQFLLTLDKVEGFNLEQEPTLALRKEPSYVCKDKTCRHQHGTLRYNG